MCFFESARFYIILTRTKVRIKQIGVKASCVETLLGLFRSSRMNTEPRVSAGCFTLVYTTLNVVTLSDTCWHESRRTTTFPDCVAGFLCTQPPPLPGKPPTVASHPPIRAQASRSDNEVITKSEAQGPN
jgi:hypothetical protein